MFRQALVCLLLLFCFSNLFSRDLDDEDDFIYEGNFRIYDDNTIILFLEKSQILIFNCPTDFEKNKMILITDFFYVPN